MANRKGRSDNGTREQDAHINVRLPADLNRRLRERAEAQERSVSGEVRIAVQRHLADEQNKAAA